MSFEISCRWYSPTDLPTLSTFLCCAPSLITQATPQRPNSQGKMRLLVQFKDQAAATLREQATFQAEDGLGWDFIVYKEYVAAAPKAYPYIHHFPGGQPPAEGSPFNSVNTATVTALLKRLHPLHSFPKPLSNLPQLFPPPSTSAPSQPPNNNPPNHAPPPAAPPAPLLLTPPTSPP